MGRLRLTSHAVERYQLRWAPDLTMGQVREELTRLAESAKPTNSRTPEGQEIWMTALADSNVRFVVKRDRGERICVTILPEGAGELKPLFQEDEMADLLDESAEDRKFMQELIGRDPKPPEPPKPGACNFCEVRQAFRFSPTSGKIICPVCYEKKRSDHLIEKCTKFPSTV